jgi:hypothetical protein
MQDEPLSLSSADLERIVEQKITCPFLGSAVRQQQLAVRHAADNPLARIEDVKMLGNTGGGDLGELLSIFAAGNHARMRGSTGNALNAPVPAELFSLELPGSQGSHPGHSGILEGDPTELDSGRLSKEDFDRLADLANKDGLIKRSDLGNFIAANLRRDPRAKVTGAAVAELLVHDLGAFVEAIGPTLIPRMGRSDEDADKAHRILEEKLTKLLGEDNLVGSAGEFGLLFAFLSNSPDRKEVAGEPALSLNTVRAMFVDKRLPDGWKTWRKSRADWTIHTVWLLLAAYKEYRRIPAG